jgi:hypothetical protein
VTDKKDSGDKIGTLPGMRRTEEANEPFEEDDPALAEQEAPWPEPVPDEQTDRQDL